MQWHKEWIQLRGLTLASLTIAAVSGVAAADHTCNAACGHVPLAAGEPWTAAAAHARVAAALAPLAPRYQVAALLRMTVDDWRSAQIEITPHGYLVDSCAPIALTSAAAMPASTPGVSAADVPVTSPPSYNSRPGSSNVIYLDFNGATITGTYWNDVNSVTTYEARPYNTQGSESTFSDAEQTAIRRIWERVAEDFAPFDVNVTTDEPTTFTRTTGTILITNSVDDNSVNMPSSGGGGVAVRGVWGISSYATYYSPALVYFNNLGGGREDFVAEAASHEIGHNFGLRHHGTVSNEYYTGHGSGETSWSPIMGTGYNSNVSQWSNGSYYNANRTTQDDLAVIAADIGYRTDDVGDSAGAATATTVSGLTYTGSGIIEREADVDWWSFSIPSSGNLSISVQPWDSEANTRGANLDVKLVLYSDNGTVAVQSADVDGDIDASLVATVAAGTYHLTVAGTGSGDPSDASPTGYTSYASLGQYDISATLATSGSGNLAPTDLALSSSQVAENQSAGALVGTLSASDANSGDSFTYALVSGTGSTDNSSFAISGSNLVTATTFDFESDASYNVRVRVTDSGGLTYEEALAISITNANEAPTDVALSSSIVAENQSVGTLVGSLSTTDDDAGDSHTYSLVAGSGDDDNALFSISGSNLITAASLDHEVQATRTVRLQATDRDGLTYQEAVIISVSDENESPTLTVASQITIAVGSSAVLQATVSDPEDAAGGLSVSAVISGTSASIISGPTNSSGTVSTALQGDSVGSTTLRLSVTDSASVTVQQDIEVVVFDPTDATRPTSTVATMVFSGFVPNGTTALTVDGVAVGFDYVTGAFSTTVSNPGLGGSFVVRIELNDGSTQSRTVEFTAGAGSL